jgi:hypothetical protein
MPIAVTRILQDTLCFTFNGGCLFSWLCAFVFFFCLELWGVRGSSDDRAMNVTLIDYTDDFHILACIAVAMQRWRIFKAVSGQQLDNHVPAGANMSATIGELCFLCGLCRDVVNKNPCGGEFEYLHRDPASRRRQWKGKSQIWDSIRWSRVSNDSDSRKTMLAKPAASTKDRPGLSSERAPQKHKTISVKV